MSTMTQQNPSHTVDNTDILGPRKFLLSLDPILRVIIVVVLLFSTARYLVDGVFLELAGRSLSGGGDFAAYYTAGAMIRNNQNIYDNDLAATMSAVYAGAGIKSAGFLYPPLLAIICAPLSLLPFSLAYKLWVIIQNISLFAGLYLLARNLPVLGKWAFPLLFFMATNMYPNYLAVDIGQVNLTIFFIFVLIIHLARKGHLFWVGAVIALGATLKVVPLLLIGFFILQQSWRVLLGLIVGLLALLIFMIIFSGPQTILNFFSYSLVGTIPSQISWDANASLAGYIDRLAGIYGFLGQEQLLRWGVTGLFLAILGLISLKRYALGEHTFTLVISIWITCILLISPTTWEHNFAWIIPLLGSIAMTLVVISDRVPLSYYFGLGVLYILIAFENLPVSRFGQWNFGTGWWIFKGDYLQHKFVADIRLYGIMGCFVLGLLLLYKLQPEAYNVFANVKNWFREFFPARMNNVSNPSSQST